MPTRLTSLSAPHRATTRCHRVCRGWLPGLVGHILGAGLFLLLAVPVVPLHARQGKPAPVEARSLLGAPLHRAPLADQVLAEMEIKLRSAIERRDEAPNEVESWVWVGRRQAYLGRFQEAIATFSVALERFGDDAQLLRHRGHRWLSIRKFDNAVADLERAAALIAGRPDVIEQDGLPNEAGIPTSTLGGNIYYHLGLARYLRREFDQAANAYGRCLSFASHPDMRIATEYWLLLALERAGRQAEAAELRAGVPTEIELLESGDYHRLIRLQRGEERVKSMLRQARAAGGVANTTVLYGVSMALLQNGRRAGARRLWREISKSPAWASFGYLAAEAEIAHPAP